MAYGLCDVPQCERKTYMGWCPLTERIGRQVCEYHFRRHKSKAGSFSLYDAFGFQRPLTIAETVKMKDYCTCGNELQPGRKYCRNCISKRKRQQRKEYYHRKKQQSESVTPSHKDKFLMCRSEYCENEREPNHRYCSQCAIRQRRKLDRIRKRKIRSIKTG